jgi:RNA polymerase sigma-70 factor (ECF subfamily)
MSNMDIEQNREDLELVKALRSGDYQAFDSLIGKHSGRMFQTAYGLIGNKQDAEEVVQDALVRIYRHIDQFRGDSSFSTWVYRIVVNLSRNKYQWNRRRGSELTSSISEKIREDDSAEKSELLLADSSMTPERIIDGSETEEAIMKAIGDLPEKLREVTVLRHIEDMSYEQIAELLETNMGTIKSRIARARETLTTKIKEYLK